MRTLITGGVKSGKSGYALKLAAAFPPGPGPYFLATARAFDDEMRERIARHRAERGPGFVTIEEPVAIHEAIRERTVIDCIPMWLNNLFYDGREDEIEPILGAFIERMPRECVIVTNETGMGIIPADATSRRYGLALGVANARLAAAVDRVVLMVSGISLEIKRPEATA
jgi:adenosylcobinamide kinase / adenosylcobinamide-phosphate guanylyltransferase